MGYGNGRLVCVAAIALGIVSVSAQREETHGRDAVPDYDKVFNQETIGRLDLRIPARAAMSSASSAVMRSWNS